MHTRQKLGSQEGKLMAKFRKILHMYFTTKPPFIYLNTYSSDFGAYRFGLWCTTAKKCHHHCQNGDH